METSDLEPVYFSLDSTRNLVTGSYSEFTFSRFQAALSICICLHYSWMFINLCSQKDYKQWPAPHEIPRVTLIGQSPGPRRNPDIRRIFFVILPLMATCNSNAICQHSSESLSPHTTSFSVFTLWWVHHLDTIRLIFKNSKTLSFISLLFLSKIRWVLTCTVYIQMSFLLFHILCPLWLGSGRLKEFILYNCVLTCSHTSLYPGSWASGKWCISKCKTEQWEH